VVGLLGGVDVRPVPGVRHTADPGRAVALYAALATAVSARLAPLLAVLLAAVSTDAELRQFVTAIEAERRAGNERFAAHLASIGGLHVDPGRAADLLWLFTAPDTYHRLVGQRGWSPGDFEGWLAETLTAQLVHRPGGAHAAAAR
jgi:hypothetical protein